LIEAMRRKADEPIPAPLFSLYKDYLDQLRREREAAAYELTRAEGRVEKQRQALVQASVERKVIERLKERQKQVHTELEAHKQQNISDELAALARSRRIREEQN
ncbi:MAG: flagellar export protein FliJ, partial [Pseudomonadota bacterium]